MWLRKPNASQRLRIHGREKVKKKRLRSLRSVISSKIPRRFCFVFYIILVWECFAFLLRVSFFSVAQLHNKPTQSLNNKIIHSVFSIITELTTSAIQKRKTTSAIAFIIAVIGATTTTEKHAKNQRPCYCGAFFPHILGLVWHYCALKKN